MNSRLSANRVLTGVALAIVLALGIPATGAAEATNETTVEMDRDFSDIVGDPCPGAGVGLILLEGHNHTVVHMTTDSNLGTHTMTITVDIHGKGVGLDEFLTPLPDVTYSVMDTQTVSVNIPSGSSTEATTDLYYRAVRNEETLLPDDFFMHELVHATVVRGLPVVSFTKGDPAGKCA
jgi:hypothetical protein